MKTPKDYTTIFGVSVATWQEHGLWHGSFTAKDRKGTIKRYRDDTEHHSRQSVLSAAKKVIARDFLLNA